MLVLILLFLPSLSYPFDVKKTGRSPIITPVNDSFVLVNYQDAFIIEDFSEVVKIEFYNKKQQGREISEYYALADKSQSMLWIDPNKRIVQPLVEGADLLAKMNPCKTYNYLYVRISGHQGHKDSIQFDYSPVQKCEETINSWICQSHEDNSIILSQEKSDVFQVRNCLKEVGICNTVGNGNGVRFLPEGKNNIRMEDENKTIIIIKLYLEFHEFHEFSDCKQVELLSCTDQCRMMLLRNTSDWICVNGNYNINISKTEWYDFKIEEIYFGDQLLEFGINTIENIPESLKIELTTIIGEIDDYDVRIEDMIPVTFTYHLTNCADKFCLKSENVNNTNLYVIGTAGGLFIIVVIIAIVVISKYSQTKANKQMEVSKDVNPTYGETVEYDGYYTETKVTDENEDYNKEQYDEDEYIQSEIRDKNDGYHFKGM